MGDKRKTNHIRLNILWSVFLKLSWRVTLRLVGMLPPRINPAVIGKDHTDKCVVSPLLFCDLLSDQSHIVST